MKGSKKETLPKPAEASYVDQVGISSTGVRILKETLLPDAEGMSRSRCRTLYCRSRCS